MKPEISGQPIEMAIGPPLFHACAKVVKQPLRMEITEKEIAKFEKPDQVRFSSCLYPSAANRRSSSEVLSCLLLLPVSCLSVIIEVMGNASI